MMATAEREKIMLITSSKARNASHANVFRRHDVIMGWSAAALSVKGITMSIAQNVEGDPKGIRRSSTVKLKRKQRAGSPDLSLLTFKRESQACKRGSRSGRLGLLYSQFLRLPTQRRYWDPMHYQKGVVSTC